MDRARRLSTLFRTTMKRPRPQSEGAHPRKRWRSSLTTVRPLELRWGACAYFAPVIPYVSDEQADAATKDPHVKLVFRLLHFAVLADGESLLNYRIALD